MCSKEKAQALVGRLKTLPFFGSPSEFGAARKEVGLALIDATADDAHATTVTDGLMRRLHKFPVPADVYEEAAGTRPKTDCYSAEFLYGPGEPIECDKCHDNGWFTDDESGKFVACQCRIGTDQFTIDMVAKLNSKFTTGGRREVKRNAPSSREWCEKHGLPI